MTTTSETTMFPGTTELPGIDWASYETGPVDVVPLAA